MGNLPPFLNPREVYIIAEIGLNHNGDLDLARRHIVAAADAGVDAVKFQTFATEKFLSKDVPSRDARSQLELPHEWLVELKEMAGSVGVDFSATPLDHDSADVLVELDVPWLKVASSDTTNLPFLRYLGKMNKPILLSTGFSTLADVDAAVATILSTGNEQLVLLHCVSEYPTPLENLNLRAIRTLSEAFQLPVGLSDHTSETSVAPIAATALGARVIEKHFTLDRSLKGYDHQMSATPEMMEQMVQDVRLTTKALGSGKKVPTEMEVRRSLSARRSLYWKASYETGRHVDPKMVIALRPGDGLPPSMIELISKARLRKPVLRGERVEMNQLEW